VLGPWAFVDLGTGGADDRLDLVTVDDAGDVGVADFGGGKAGDRQVISDERVSYNHDKKKE
jgi:hypothetical protein